MRNCFRVDTPNDAIPILPLLKGQFESWRVKQNYHTQSWVQLCKFSAESGQVCLLPGQNGEPECVLLGLANAQDSNAFAALPALLGAGQFRIESNQLSEALLHQAAIAFGMGAYQFNVYRENNSSISCLCLPENLDHNLIQQWVKTLNLIRDLINTPTQDMGPTDLTRVIMEVGDEFGAKTNVIIGEDLLEQGYPAIHAVGRASQSEAHLIDLIWGNPEAPLLTLVGKGVCFDSGGLNLKPANGMLLMKKDMAGAAHALGLARMVMAQELPFRLRLLIPAVENSVSGNSYRPGDVLDTRAGMTVEVTNTDAEGRLVLCDALAEACRENPRFLIDFSTLTGAARIALGPQLPAMFCNNEQMASRLLACAERTQDLFWRLPLHQSYRQYLKSTIADICNASNVDHAGSITAALFLQSFVQNTVNWAHFDMSAWNYEDMPGRPRGAQTMAVRAVFNFLEDVSQEL